MRWDYFLRRSRVALARKCSEQIAPSRAGAPESCIGREENSAHGVFSTRDSSR